jgi:hypothetical protein
VEEREMLNRKPGQVQEMMWDGTQERSEEIETWARNADLMPRWFWRPGSVARLLVEREFPESASWEIVPVGSTVRRAYNETNSPLDVVWPKQGEIA